MILVHMEGGAAREVIGKKIRSRNMNKQTCQGLWFSVSLVCVPLLAALYISTLVVVGFTPRFSRSPIRLQYEIINLKDTSK